MENGGPPKKQIEVRPGESHLDAILRELSTNPDSPASLRVLSAVGQAMAPRTRAVAQIVEALEALLLNQGEAAEMAVTAAIGHWERECGVPMEPSLLESLREEARQRIERLRRQPPSMDSILTDRPQTSDVGYKLGVDLEGFEGTWHRLWAIVAMTHSFENDIDTDTGVATVRDQFEARLGRRMTAPEWDALVAHAKNHAETVMKPTQGAADGGSSGA